LAASTAKTHVSALSYTFQLGGFQDFTQHFIVKKQLQGFSKVRPSSDSRLPITPPILLKIVSVLPMVTDSEFTRLLLHAMFVLAFHAFLRVGELTKTTASSQHFLLAKHLSLTASQSEKLIELQIPHYKHSTQTTTLIIRPNPSKPLLCPYLACRNYLLARKHLSP
jgi:hypothetical protein